MQGKDECTNWINYAFPMDCLNFGTSSERKVVNIKKKKEGEEDIIPNNHLYLFVEG